MLLFFFSFLVMEMELMELVEMELVVVVMVGGCAW